MNELEGDVGGNTDRSSRVDAVVDMYGPVDLPAWVEWHRQPGFLSSLFGGPLAQKRPMFDLASPVSHITSDDPPILILHGDKDEMVPLSQSERFHELYKKAGLDAQLHVIPGAGHTGVMFTDSDRRALIVGFLDKWRHTPRKD